MMPLRSNGKMKYSRGGFALFQQRLRQQVEARNNGAAATTEQLLREHRLFNILALSAGSNTAKRRDPQTMESEPTSTTGWNVTDSGDMYFNTGKVGLGTSTPFATLDLGSSGQIKFLNTMMNVLGSYISVPPGNYIVIPTATTGFVSQQNWVPPPPDSVGFNVPVNGYYFLQFYALFLSEADLSHAVLISNSEGNKFFFSGTSRDLVISGSGIFLCYSTDWYNITLVYKNTMDPIPVQEYQVSLFLISAFEDAP